MSTVVRPVVCLIAALALAAVAPGQALAQAAKAGVVTALEGSVTVARAASPQPSLLKFKDDVFLEDKITAGNRSIARLLLGGKAIVTVRELSTLTIRQVPGQATIDLESGKIALAVARDQMRQGETIIIRTTNAVGAVRGTVVVAEVVRQSAQLQAPTAPVAPPVVTNFYVLSGTLLATTVNPLTRAPLAPPVTLNVLQGFSAAGAAPARVAPITQAQLGGITAGLKPAAPAYKEGGPSKEAVKAQSMQTASALLTAMFGPPAGATTTPTGAQGQIVQGEGTPGGAQQTTGGTTAGPTTGGAPAFFTTPTTAAAMFGAFTGGTGADALAALFGAQTGTQGESTGVIPGGTGGIPGTPGAPFTPAPAPFAPIGPIGGPTFTLPPLTGPFSPGPQAFGPSGPLPTTLPASPFGQPPVTYQPFTLFSPPPPNLFQPLASTALPGKTGAANLLANGLFQSGTLANWTVSGAGTVLSSLGSTTINPLGGGFMFFGHTGNGATNNTTSTVSQSFNVTSVLSIKFGYALFTREANCSSLPCVFQTDTGGVAKNDRWEVRLVPSSGSTVTLFSRTVQDEISAGGFVPVNQVLSVDTNGDNVADFTTLTNTARTRGSNNEFTIVTKTAVVAAGTATLEFSVTDVGDTVVDSGALFTGAVVTQDPPLYFLRDGGSLVRTDPSPLLRLTSSPRTFDSLMVVCCGSSASLAGPLLHATHSDLTVPFSLLSVIQGGSLVTSSAAPLTFLEGGTHALGASVGVFDVAGTTTGVDPETGLTLGLTRPLRHAGAFLETSGAAVTTEKVLKLDTALLEATAPLINLLAGSSLTTSTDAVDLSYKAKVTSLGPLVSLNASSLTVRNGALVGLANGSVLNVTGSLVQLSNGSILNLLNGPLLSVASGSILNVSGALVAFGGTGGNAVNIANSLCNGGCYNAGGIPVALVNGASAANVSITSPVKNAGLGSINLASPNTAAVVVSGPTSKVTISGQ